MLALRPRLGPSSCPALAALGATAIQLATLAPVVLEHNAPAEAAGGQLSMVALRALLEQAAVASVSFGQSSG